MHRPRAAERHHGRGFGIAAALRHMHADGGGHGLVDHGDVGALHIGPLEVAALPQGHSEGSEEAVVDGAKLTPLADPLGGRLPSRMSAC